MKIVSIDFNSSISEIEVENVDQFIKQNRLIQIYYWRFNDKRINCYVNIEENMIRNSHILPSSGISDIFAITENNALDTKTEQGELVWANQIVLCDLSPGWFLSVWLHYQA